MPQLTVVPADLPPLGAQAATAATQLDPAPVAAAFAAGAAALGGLSSADALLAVAAVWTGEVQRLHAAWSAFATLVGRAADQYVVAEAAVARAAGP